MWILCIILSAAFAAAVLYIVLLRRDIRRMATQLRHISQTGTNAQLTTITRDRNVVALALSVNRALEESRTALLDTARRENNLKRALTNISHDLRTPLTSAIGYLQMLESADSETQARYTEIIRGRLDVLVVLMNRLFEFTHTIEGQTPIELKRVDISRILRELLAAFYPELCEKGFTVEADIPEAPVYVVADEDALARVLQNVMCNVVVYGKEYMLARVAGCEITIGNKAIDASKIDADRLFERFYTADASRASQSTGLGLGIAKELVTRMDGQITAEVLDDMVVLRIRLPLC